MPGLIEGASAGLGLGHAFLRHVERTRILVHIVDGSSRDPEWDHEVIREELRAHDPALLEKPMLVAFNKIDVPAAREAWPAFKRAREKEGLTVLAISAAAGEGLDEVRAHLGDMLPDAAELAGPPEATGVVIHRIEAMTDGFIVERLEAGVFRVRGARIERAAAQTNFDVEESAERFQRDLARLGIDDELRRAGICASLDDESFEVDGIDAAEALVLGQHLIDRARSSAPSADASCLRACRRPPPAYRRARRAAPSGSPAHASSSTSARGRRAGSKQPR